MRGLNGLTVRRRFVFRAINFKFDSRTSHSEEDLPLQSDSHEVERLQLMRNLPKREPLKN